MVGLEIAKTQKTQGFPGHCPPGTPLPQRHNADNDDGISSKKQ
jgi:hypothetical protein